LRIYVTYLKAILKVVKESDSYLASGFCLVLCFLNGIWLW